MQEIWKDIKGYEGLYQVSNLGRVKSLRYNRLMSLRTDYRGYLDVMFSVDAKTKRYKVHRLVAQAFIPNTENKPQVNHKDENKQNNNVENLEWCTNEYNSNYGTVRERRLKTALKNRKENPKKYKKNYSRKSNFWQPKEITQYSLDGKFIKNWDSMKEASKELKIPPQNISECCRGIRKKAKGFIWKYKI